LQMSSKPGAEAALPMELPKGPLDYAERVHIYGLDDRVELNDCRGLAIAWHPGTADSSGFYEVALDAHFLRVYVRPEHLLRAHTFDYATDLRAIDDRMYNPNVPSVRMRDVLLTPVKTLPTDRQEPACVEHEAP